MIAGLLQQNLVDYIGMDVKAPLAWEAYRKAAGLPEDKEQLFENVKRTLGLLKSAQVTVELRCTVVPQIHSSEDILTLARQLRGHRSFMLQQFVPERALDPAFRERLPFKAEALKEIHSRIKAMFPSSELRGI
jgi:pyruvate-formate lyase-activating enzyme